MLSKRLLPVFFSLLAACVAPAPEKLLEIEPFTLVDDAGKTFDSRSLLGRPALLFFGYTHCPDACPTMMSRVAGAYREAGPDAARIPTLFVSVDPRDTPEVLNKYMSYFRGVPARGLTGTREQIDAVVKQFGAHYQIRDTGSAAGPMVDHSVRLYLIDKEGDVIALFDPDTKPADIAKAMKRAL